MARYRIEGFMIATRVIPCLDCRDGRVVKGVKFQNLRDAGSPVELAAAYEAQGADELVILDVSATPEGKGHALDTVRAVRNVLSIPLTVGGGVRTTDDASALLLAGADKVSVNTAAVKEPKIISDIADRFGRQCAIVAIDAARKLDAPSQSADGRGIFEVVIQSGKVRTGIDVIDWAKRITELGAGEILLTSFDRDGTRSGYDLELLRAVRAVVTVPIIASGGAAHAMHLVEALQAGADAVLAASIFHDGEKTVGDVKKTLAENGIRVRT